MVADYLRGDSDINFLLHVRTEAMLATLAEELDLCHLRPDGLKQEFKKVIDRFLDQGSLLLSVRDSIDFPLRDRKHEIVPGSIPRAANCTVIYHPPFYVVHTPGLFEGTLHLQSMSRRTALEPAPASVRLRRK